MSADLLARWIHNASSSDNGRLALEDALLSGRISRYFTQRLRGMLLSQSFALVVHVLEFTLLWSMFHRRGLLGSLLAQNLCAVLGATWFGALEALRARIRSETQTSHRARIVGHWLGSAWVMAAIACATACVMAYRAPQASGLFAALCVVRLGSDVVVRTWQAGVYALGRTARPTWSFLCSPFITGAVTLATYRWLHAYAFVLATATAAAVSSALTVHFASRAYRVRRQVLPVVRRPALAEVAPLAVARGAALLLVSRIGSVAAFSVAIAAMVQQTASQTALLLHLVAPLVALCGEWAFAFYHDFRKLEGVPTASLRAQLMRRAWRFAAELSLITIVLAGVATLALTHVLTAMLYLAPLLVTQAFLSLGQIVRLLRPPAASTSLHASLYDFTRASLRDTGRCRFARLTLRDHTAAAARALATTISARAHVFYDNDGRLFFAETQMHWTSSTIARAAGGIVARVVTTPLCDTPQDAWEHAIALGIFASAQAAVSHLALREEFQRLRPDGFIIDLSGGALPAAFVALSSELRQRIWHAALASAGGRAPSRLAFEVHSFCPNGTIALVLVAPRVAGQSFRHRMHHINWAHARLAA